MWRNIYFDGKNSLIHLWDTTNGNNSYTKIDWVPYVFRKSNENDIKTIEGEFAEKVEFGSYSDYYHHCKNNHGALENKVRPEVQFLAERYYGIADNEMEVPELNNYYMDIEVVKYELDKNKKIKIRRKI